MFVAVVVGVASFSEPAEGDGDDLVAVGTVVFDVVIVIDAGAIYDPVMVLIPVYFVDDADDAAMLIIADGSAVIMGIAGGAGIKGVLGDG